MTIDNIDDPVMHLRRINGSACGTFSEAMGSLIVLVDIRGAVTCARCRATTYYRDYVDPEPEVLTEQEWREQQDANDREWARAHGEPECQQEWDNEVRNWQADQAHEAALAAQQEHEPVYLCTCCRPARPIVATVPDPKDKVRDANDNWRHEHDNSRALTIHAHVDDGGTDCDGPIEHHNVSRPNSHHDVKDKHHWQADLVEGMVTHYLVGGVLLIEVQGAYWRAPTDEGHEYKQVTWCEDPACAYKDGWQRDVFAEQMGY